MNRNSTLVFGLNEANTKSARRPSFDEAGDARAARPSTSSSLPPVAAEDEPRRLARPPWTPRLDEQTSHRDSSSRWTCRRRGQSQEGCHRGRHDRLAVSETSRMPSSFPDRSRSRCGQARRRSRGRLSLSLASSSHAALALYTTYRSPHFVSLTRGRCCV